MIYLNQGFVLSCNDNDPKRVELIAGKPQGYVLGPVTLNNGTLSKAMPQVFDYAEN